MKPWTVILGTRPEVIKLAPVIHEARKQGHSVRVIATGQHRELTYPLMKHFGLKADLDLDVMCRNQDLTELSERVLRGFNQERDVLLNSEIFVVQGDTTSAWLGAFWGFIHRIPIAHVEAGLRTYDLTAPFPEEANRQLMSRITDLHFAPTLQAARALMKEGIQDSKISVVGNTSIDALYWTLKSLGEKRISDIPEIPKDVRIFAEMGPYLLVTAHRRESFGEGFEGICEGLLGLLSAEREIRLIYPVHPNPKVREKVTARLSDHPRILLCDPIPYVGFLALLRGAAVVLTDSGGVQEEAPSLLKPIIVLRDQTERPEGVEAGFSHPVGTSPQKIIKKTQDVLREGLATQCANPYGDGLAALRIVQKIAGVFHE